MRTLALALVCVLLAACVTTGNEDVGKSESPEEAAKINVQLGATYLRQGNLEFARQRLEKAIEQDPNLASAHTYVALVYDKLGDYDGAETHYKRALRLDKTNAALLNLYGAFLCRQNRVADAEKYFLDALRDPLYRTPEAALTNAGICVLREPDLDKAEAYFRRALDANPKYPDALWQMTRVSFDRQVFLQSRAFFQRYAAVGPMTPQALWLGVRIERELGAMDAAEEYARRLRDDFPDALETRLLIESESDGGTG